MERWTSAFHLTLFINNTDSGSDLSPWITCVLPEPSSIIWNKMKWWTSWPVSGNLVHDVPLLIGRQLRPTDIYDAFFVNETDLHLNPSNVSQCQWNHYITVAPVASHRSPFYPVTLSGEQFELLRRHTTSIHDHIQCYHRDSPGRGDTLLLGSEEMLSPRECCNTVNALYQEKMLIRQ